MRLLFTSGTEAVSIDGAPGGPHRGRPIRSVGDALPRAGVAARGRLALGRLDALGATLPPRLLFGTGLAAAAALIPLLAHYSAVCAGKYAAAAVFVAVPVTPLLSPPRAGARPARDLAGLRHMEDGFSILESLIAAALIASVVVGATVVFAGQKQSVGQVTVPDGLRDHVSAVDVDANALQAYDPAVRSKIQAGGMQLWTAPLPGTSDVVTLQAQPASSGVTIVAKNGSQAASIIAPLPQPKPTPQ